MTAVHSFLHSRLIFITQGTFLTDNPSYVQTLYSISDRSGSRIALFHVSLILIGDAIESPKRKTSSQDPVSLQNFTL